MPTKFPKASALRKNGLKLYGSVWLFPIVTILLFILLVIAGINGSSEDIYVKQLTGNNNYKDTSLIAGTPRSIRSDEWIVNTQMVIAQYAAGFPSTNHNIGHGQDMNIIIDVPTRNWSQIFRPQNYAFFILPFENAYAYRWWFEAILLIISVYFFALEFLRGKRLVSSGIAIATFFSGFLQWWYLDGTLGCIAYPIAIALLYIYFLRANSIRQKVLLSAGITFLLVCFAMVLYPPFQIPVAIVLACFLVGYTFSKYTLPDFLRFLRHMWLYWLIIVLGVAGVLGAYIYQNRNVIEITQHTAYPGKRIVHSGGYSISHLLSGTLALQHERKSKAPFYMNTNPNVGATNQSESSTFIFISLFLVLPLLDLLRRSRKMRIDKLNQSILFGWLGLSGAVLLSWLFIPHLSILGSISKLNIVPLNRAIIGLGLLNIFLLVGFIWLYDNGRFRYSRKMVFGYSGLVLLSIIVIHLHIHHIYPGFVTKRMAVLLALPVPIAMYFLLRKHFRMGILILAAFSFLGAGFVNPLSHGLGYALTNPLITYIKKLPNDRTYWIAEDINLENTPLMAGKPSLSGVFDYPQNSLWYPIDHGTSIDKYNRYAHVSYNIDKNPQNTIKTGFIDTTNDHLVIQTEVCSNFVRKSNIRHIVSSAQYSQKDQSCISMVKPIHVGLVTYYIYTLRF